MGKFKSSLQSLFSVNPATFEKSALELFRYQARRNPVYRKFISNLGISPDKIQSIYKIPFLPVEFFKTQKVVTGQWKEEMVFESSGTTGQQRSRHYIQNVRVYHEICQRAFEMFYGPVREFHFLALLPSYLERGNSSLVSMMDHFIQQGSAYSGFYLSDYDRLVHRLKKLKDGDKPVLLIGVSFALLDLAEQYELDLKNVFVMETGGMKGRRKELVRDELHTILMDKFRVRSIHSEYGMTELMSQAYAKKDGQLGPPPWMKILLRDPNDPFNISPDRESGGINIIDLANWHSCAFLETRDIGRLKENDIFNILGRLDNSDIRGCNLMVL